MSEGTTISASAKGVSPWWFLIGAVAIGGGIWYATRPATPATTTTTPPPNQFQTQPQQGGDLGSQVTGLLNTALQFGASIYQTERNAALQREARSTATNSGTSSVPAATQGGYVHNGVTYADQSAYMRALGYRV